MIIIIVSNEEFNKFNKRGWNKLSKSNNLFSNTSLPEYGPYMKNEYELELFKNVAGKKVLELGCGCGKSLEFLANKGAAELWGIDISQEQIIKARDLKLENSNFLISSMEKNPGLPLKYFDYVLSLYSIGYSVDPLKTLKLSSEYLKSGGKFILCWTHPFFNCLGIKDEKIEVSHNYNDEDFRLIKKGNDEVELFQYNLKISTLINGIISSGLEIDSIIEESDMCCATSYKSSYFHERKLAVAPTTLIIVAHKK